MFVAPAGEVLKEHVDRAHAYKLEACGYVRSDDHQQGHQSLLPPALGTFSPKQRYVTLGLTLRARVGQPSNSSTKTLAFCRRLAYFKKLFRSTFPAQAQDRSSNTKLVITSLHSRRGEETFRIASRMSLRSWPTE